MDYQFDVYQYRRNASKSSCTLTFAEASESIFCLSGLSSFKNRCEFLSVKFHGWTQQNFSPRLQFIVLLDFVDFQGWQIAIQFRKIILFAKSKLSLALRQILRNGKIQFALTFNNTLLHFFLLLTCGSYKNSTDQFLIFLIIFSILRRYCCQNCGVLLLSDYEIKVDSHA